MRATNEGGIEKVPERRRGQINTKVTRGLRRYEGNDNGESDRDDGTRTGPIWRDTV